MLPARTSTDLTHDDNERMRQLGQAADAAATATVFARYNRIKADNTKAAKAADLRLFVEYLRHPDDPHAVANLPDPKPEYEQIAAAAERKQNDAGAWSGVTWGIVEGFVEWLLRRGMAQSSIGRALSTVKVYARLAHKAGAFDSDNALRIRAVVAYAGKEGRRVDDERAAAGMPTRKGNKKVEAVAITDAQAKALKKHPDTAQGRRDALLMALLLDHGLRESELEHVKLAGFDLAAGTFTFWRPKVNLDQTHKMTPATARAMRAWIDAGECPAMGPILRSSRKGGELLDQAMSLSAIRARVRSLGSAVGVDNLSPHDCRHYWATKWGRKADRGEISLFRLQEAGGWASLAMPRKYVALAAIANEGMHEDGDD